MLRRALEREGRPSDLIEERKEDPEAEEEDERPAAVNIFNLLGDENTVEDGVEEDQDEPQSPVPRATTPAKKSTKKKKRKGKAKSSAEAEEDLFLSKFMEVMPTTNASPSPSPVESKQLNVNEKRAAVISVDPKHLRPEEELRVMFGSKVINAVEGSMRRKQRGTNLLRSRNYLVKPMDNWPRWDGGLSMELKDTKDGVMYFRYVRSPSYLDVQKRYEACVASHDPNTIALLLASHPYHCDSLLALADVYKHMGEHVQASALVERCLYALECAWRPLFNPLTGNCRLDYSHEENRPLFVALFRYMQQLGRRGCHRTALEVCKLLLSLDVEDPTGAKFCVDYYALRAEQYAWLESFVEDFYENKTEVVLLPNFRFSLPIARFRLEQKEAAASDALRSSDLLEQALMLHPAVLSRIVTRAPIKEDATWTSVLKHPHFAKATAGGPTLEHLINIYVERNYLLWRIPDLQQWLKAAAVAVTNKRDGEAASWACARGEAFQAEHNEYRHLSVSEFSDSTTTLPPDEEPAAVPAAAQVADLGERHPVAVFLESLLPWMNYGQEEADGDP